MTISIEEDNIVDLWETVNSDYPFPYNKELCSGINQLIIDYSDKLGLRLNRIIDCGCGSGNPSIGLKKEYGYDVTCSDMSSEMLERLRENLKATNVDLPIIPSEWRDLSKHIISEQDKFDMVICRGNSLIYATSWDRKSLLPNIAREGIIEALKNFYAILKNGGIIYLDLSNQREFETNNYYEFVGHRNSPSSAGDIILFWKVQHVSAQKIRLVHSKRIFFNEFEEPVSIKYFKFVSYLLGHNELVEMMKEVGFKMNKDNIFIDVHGEKLYDVFIGIKQDD